MTRHPVVFLCAFGENLPTDALFSSASEAESATIARLSALETAGRWKLSTVQSGCRADVSIELMKIIYPEGQSDTSPPTYVGVQCVQGARFASAVLRRISYFSVEVHHVSPNSHRILTGRNAHLGRCSRRVRVRSRRSFTGSAGERGRRQRDGLPSEGRQAGHVQVGNQGWQVMGRDELEAVAGRARRPHGHAHW